MKVGCCYDVCHCGVVTEGWVSEHHCFEIDTELVSIRGEGFCEVWDLYLVSILFALSWPTPAMTLTKAYRHDLIAPRMFYIKIAAWTCKRKREVETAYVDASIGFSHNVDFLIFESRKVVVERLEPVKEIVCDIGDV